MPARLSVAAPQGGVVVSGQANISTSGATTNISQSTQQAIINWQLFSIAPKETVNFNQPGPSSVTLNRVIGNEKSVIEGALNANGQVFIVNSAGIVFTKSAQVNVGGLVASTLDISNSDFKAAKYQFSGNSTAAVINNGNIQANPGGYVALLGSTVSNQGTITATLGTVAMASGSQVTLNFGGNSLVDVTTDKGTLNALVENKGAIVADGGQVILTARAADALLSAQVNNTGVIQARTMAGLTGGAPRKGSIKVVANGGRVRVAGRLDASAPNGGDGGTIETSGEKVTVADDAVITTKAASGKRGLWLIDPDGFTIASSGGDITGATLSSQLNNGDVTIQSSSGTGYDSAINVNDTVSWAADTTLTLNASYTVNVNAPITATGANAHLVANGYLFNVNAPNALNVPNIGGTINYDFNILQSQAWTTAPDLTNLTVGGNVNVKAPLTWSSGALTLAGGNVNVNAPVTWSANAALTLNAINNISITAPITATGANGELMLNAGVSVNVNAANALNVGTIGGTINHDLNILQSQAWATAPDLTGLTVAGNFSVNAPLTWSAGALTLTGGNVNVNAPVTWSANASLTLGAAGDINIAAPITATGAAAGLVLSAGADVNVGAANALKVATISGTVNHDFNISQSQAWTTPTDLTGLMVANNVNVNAPLTWTGALKLAAANNINVNAPLSWSAGTLTLNAGKNVDVNAVMTVSGAGNFAASYGYVLDGNGNPTTTPTAGGNADGTPYGLYTSLGSTGAYTGRIDVSGSGSVTLNGQNYTVINSNADLNALGSHLSGNYVLGSNIAASGLGEIAPFGFSGPATFTGDFNGFGHMLTVAPVSSLSIDSALSIATLKNTNLVLNSSGAISINAPVTSGAGVLSFNAGGQINLNASLQSTSDNIGSFVLTGSGMTVGTTASVSGASVILNAPTSWSSDAALTLAAIHNIYIDRPITATGANAGLVLNYGDDYVLKDASTSITLSGANPSLTINGNAYQVINTLAQLEAISPNASTPANGFYALGSDINAWGVVFSGPVVNDLEGTLAGFNHVIRNLTINDQSAIVTLGATTLNDALIGTLGAAGLVRDVGMFNTNVNAGWGLATNGSVYGGSASALVNFNLGTIRNSYAIGGSIFGQDNIGGLVAWNFGSITNSHTNLAVTGQSYVGGLVGANYPTGTIESSYANGPVSSSPGPSLDSSLAGSASIGGLVGINYGVIKNSHATGSVTATDSFDVGGLVGTNSNLFGSTDGNGNINQGVIKNSYATGTVNVFLFNAIGTNNTTQGVGGLAGSNNGGSITYSRASGDVTVAALGRDTAGFNVGGLVGYNSSSLFGTGGIIDHGTASGAVTAVVGITFSVGGLVGNNADPYTQVSNSFASGPVNIGEYQNASINAGGLFGSAASGANYSGNSWDISGTGQTKATGGGPTEDATGGAVGTNPASTSGPSAAPSLDALTQPLTEQSQAANVVANVDTAHSAATPPRPRVAASAGTAKTSALAGPSFSDTVSSPSNQTEGEWLTNARAKAALNPSSRSDAREAKETPQRPRHAFVPRPIAKPKGAGFGATIHSIEIEGKQYELHEKSESKPQAPETKSQAPESKTQAPSDHN